MAIYTAQSGLDNVELLLVDCVVLHCMPNLWPEKHGGRSEIARSLKSVGRPAEIIAQASHRNIWNAGCRTEIVKFHAHPSCQRQPAATRGTGRHSTPGEVALSSAQDGPAHVSERTARLLEES